MHCFHALCDIKNFRYCLPCGISLNLYLFLHFTAYTEVETYNVEISTFFKYMFADFVVLNVVQMPHC